MDYGKVAYYKAEELEQRINRGSVLPFKAVTVDLPGGGRAELTGSGLIIVRVRSACLVSVYAGSDIIGEGEGDFTVAAAAGNCEISTSADGSVTAITITAAGEGIALKLILN